VVASRRARGGHRTTRAEAGLTQTSVAFGGDGAGTVVTDDVAQVLHHGGRERRMRWGSRGGGGRRGAG
jgi:hypothetical protein